MNRDTLYYDGACPLCRAEIGKLAKFSNGGLRLVDIHALDPSDAEIDPRTLLARLHLKTADGDWITGLPANIRAWQHTPFAGLWRILDWPLIRLISYPAYELWLRHRNAANCSLPRGTADT